MVFFVLLSIWLGVFYGLSEICIIGGLILKSGCCCILMRLFLFLVMWWCWLCDLSRVRLMCLMVFWVRILSFLNSV